MAQQRKYPPRLNKSRCTPSTSSDPQQKPRVVAAACAILAQSLAASAPSPPDPASRSLAPSRPPLLIRVQETVHDQHNHIPPRGDRESILPPFHLYAACPPLSGGRGSLRAARGGGQSLSSVGPRCRSSSGVRLRRRRPPPVSGAAVPWHLCPGGPGGRGRAPLTTPRPPAPPGPEGGREYDAGRV